MYQHYPNDEAMREESNTQKIELEGVAKVDGFEQVAEI